MELSKARVVIVGAGQAGGRAAEALRAAGHRGSITLIGEEDHLPYERPQLSKSMLLDAELKPAFIRTAQDWAELDITVSSSSSVIAADINRRDLGLADGRVIPFDQLLIATGTRARRLAELEGTTLPIHYLRSMDDAVALRRVLVRDRKVVLIGGGVIGLEVASAAVARGCHVTVLERAGELLPQIGSPALSRFARNLHESRGVTVVTGAAVAGAAAEGIVLSDGRQFAADIVLVGVGVEPAVGLAQQLGLDVANGIRVTATGSSGIDGVYAAGDVAEQWSRCHNRWMRVENWANAQNQAIATARHMAGETCIYDAPPWFWSDQYDVNIQIVGHPAGGEEIIRDGVAGEGFTTLSVREGEVTGGITVNSARNMAVLRRLVASRKAVRKDELENSAFDLKRSLVS